jgi:hypothetical protein
VAVSEAMRLALEVEKESIMVLATVAADGRKLALRLVAKRKARKCEQSQLGEPQRDCLEFRDPRLTDPIQSVNELQLLLEDLVPKFGSHLRVRGRFLATHLAQIIDHLRQPLDRLIPLSHKRRLRVRSFLCFSKIHLERVIHLRPLADLLVPMLQRAHNDNGAKLRLDMLTVKAENGVLLTDVVELRPTPG